MPPEETPVRFDEATEDLDGLNGPGMVRAYSLIHTTEEYGTTIAFSEKDEEWVRVAMQPTPEYNVDELVEQTHEFLNQHMRSDGTDDGGQLLVASGSSDGDGDE